MSFTNIECAQCGAIASKKIGHVNRAKKIGATLYCGRECFGIARRVNKSNEQKKAEKQEYDKIYRAKNKEVIKAKKAAYFQRSYDPEKAKIERKARAAKHAEYCRRPEYRKWKKVYDRKYRAIKSYGEYWECFLLTQDIREECLNRQSDYQIRLENQTLNKVQRRKRDVITKING